MKKVLFVIGICLLCLNFYGSKFNLVNKEWFDMWQYDSEALVVGRVMESNNAGILSNAGFLGGISLGIGDVLNYKALYFENFQYSNYYTYAQQSGLQGIAFSLVDRVTPFSNQNNLKVFYMINSLILSIILMIICWWIYKQFNIFCAIFTFIVLLSSPWLTVAGKNLYWVIWTLYLPMLLQILVLDKEESKNSEKRFIIMLMIMAFISVFIKSSCGFEFISVVLISMEIPLIYYSIKNSWLIKKYLQRAFLVGFSGLLGFGASVGLYLFQATVYFKSFGEAISNFKYTISKRTSLFDVEVAENYKESLEATYSDVFNKYFNLGSSIVGNMRINIILIILIISVILYFIMVIKSLNENEKKKINALLVCTIASFIASISWFVLAKAHSYVHTHINYLLWSIPFIIFASIFISLILFNIIKLIFLRLKEVRGCC